jgi:hypothetical protein
MLDLARLHGVQVRAGDDNTWVDAGMTLGELYYAVGMTNPGRVPIPERRVGEGRRQWLHQWRRRPQPGHHGGRTFVLRTMEQGAAISPPSGRPPSSSRSSQTSLGRWNVGQMKTLDQR